MVYKGTIPKDPEDRANRITGKVDAELRIDLEEHGTLIGPELPDGNWCKRTREWWDTWRTAPQAKLLTPTDWETMFEAALIHHEIWRPRHDKPLGHVNMVNLLSELRRRVAAFGATHEDRVKLRIQIKNPLDVDNAEQRVKQDAKGAVDYVNKLTKYAAEMRSQEESKSSATKGTAQA